MRYLILSTLLLLATLKTYAQKQSLLKGVVNETQVTSDTLDLSYSIYLPPNYSVDVPSNVIFVFDPEGEGTRASRLFSSATDTEDFVIVSNNFPLSEELDSLDINVSRAILVMRDVYLKIPTAQNEVYLSGLRSGARVASAVSYLVTDVNRLLLIDDVYFDPRFASRAKRNLAMGLVGRTSPNYYKMSDYFYQLNSISSDNVLYGYQDTGVWPDAALLTVLINRLKHINEERLKKSVPDAEYEADYRRDIVALNLLIQSEEYLTGNDLIKDAKSDYRGHVDLGSIRDLQREVRRLDEYKMARKRERSGSLEESLLVEDIAYFLEQDLLIADFENLGYWDNRIRQFEEATKNASRPREQEVAQRILGYIDYEVQNFLFQNKERLIPQRIFANVLNTLLNPKQKESYLNIIDLSAQDEDYNTAYFYLEELLKLGYSDYEELYAIPNTQFLKIKPTYNQIIEKYLGKSKF